MRIAFIGGGNMGEAMLSAVLGKGLAPAKDITVADISQERRQHLERSYGVAVTDDSRLAVQRRDVIVLAVKPQSLGEVMSGLRGCLLPEQLLLSIIAGARIGTICRGLKHRAIVRAMPNTPAQIGLGMTVWMATAEVTAQQKEWAASVLGAMGEEIAVASEDEIDMATAVSGSGPAYLFLFVEALVDAAVGIGLSRELAEGLTLATVLGAGHLIERSGASPAELRRRVTSPGGTTAAALAQLEQGDLSGLVAMAVRAAYQRAKKLGGG